MALIYKVLRAHEWRSLSEEGIFQGSVEDLRDGFIHFSAQHQLRDTVAKHYPGESALVLLSVEPEKVQDGLRWEASRGDDPFPHLYAPLQLRDVTAVHEIELSEDGLEVIFRAAAA